MALCCGNSDLRKLSKLLGCLCIPSYRSALVTHGVAAAIEHEPILRALRSRTVVDIGANRGQFALVARRTFPTAIILSVEPLDAPAARFREVFGADPQVLLHECAVGPERKDATIHVSRRDDSSSLLPIAPSQTAVFPGTGTAGTATVRVAPLDEFISAEQIEAPALLKLDVQGYELEALRGCETLLHRFAHVYCECSFVELYEGQALADEVTAWLRERGFALRGVYNMHYDRSGRAIQADFLFARA